jgi:hypothetical protein
MARDAIAHEEALDGDKVRMTFRVVLPRQPISRPSMVTWAGRRMRRLPPRMMWLG